MDSDEATPKGEDTHGQETEALRNRQVPKNVPLAAGAGGPGSNGPVGQAHWMIIAAGLALLTLVGGYVFLSSGGTSPSKRSAPLTSAGTETPAPSVSWTGTPTQSPAPSIMPTQTPLPTPTPRPIAVPTLTVAPIATTAPMPTMMPIPVTQNPLPDGYWTLCVWCDWGTYEANERGEADKRASRLRAAGFEAEIFRSDVYPTLNPGYWMATTGSFETETEARTHQTTLAGAGIAYSRVRWISLLADSGPLSGSFWTVVTGPYRTQSAAETQSAAVMRSKKLPGAVRYQDANSMELPGSWIAYSGRFQSRADAQEHLGDVVKYAVKSASTAALEP